MEEGFSSPTPADGADTTVVSAPAEVSRPWTSHYSASVPATIQIPEQSLAWLLDEATRTSSAYPAIEYYGTRITYAQLSSLADRFARALVRLGVKRGDRVAISLPNIPQFPIAFFGALKAGAVVVPTNPLYTPSELQHQLSDCGAKVVVVLDQLYHNLAEVRERTPVEHTILAGVADYFPPALAIAYRVRESVASRGKPQHLDQRAIRADKSIHTFKEFLGRASDSQGFEVFPLPEPAKPDDLALLQYTGGTTGVAKGAMLTHRNLLSNAAQCLVWNEQPLSTKHITLCVAPFFHVYGLTVAMNLTIMAASTMVLLPRFTVKDTLKAIEKYRPDLFPGVPTMYLALAREVEQRKRDLSSVKVCISGSAPLPAEVQRRFEAVSGAKVVEGYGLTEASPVTHCNPVYGDRRIGTIGLPMPNTDAAIVDEEWNFLPQGAQGEIAVRGPQVMQGYWNRPDESAKVLRDDWLRTGDIGTMSPDGYFTIVDRAKDMIIASGYNVFPREVEEALYAHPKVLEAAVVGMPDEYRGETVRAFIVAKPGEKLTAIELDQWCHDRLAIYKVPKTYEFRSSLPKTMVGKVLRRALREETLSAQRPTQEKPA